MDQKVSPPALMQIKNNSDTLIYRQAGIGTSGPQSATWDEAKWNQSPNSGAYANPPGVIGELTVYSISTP